MPKAIIYSKDGCPYCEKSKKLFETKNIPFEERDWTNIREEDKERINEITHGFSTVPKNFAVSIAPGNFIGGYSELEREEASGRLYERLGLERELKEFNDVFQAIIIGGGPAGVTAAQYLAGSYGVRTLLLTSEIGGQVLQTDLVTNAPAYEAISGPELAEKFEEVLEGTKERTGVLEYEKSATVSDISFKGDLPISEEDNRLKVVRLSDGREVLGDTIIFATGSDYRRIGIESEGRFIGRGIHFCSICDASEYKDKKVVVVGGGDVAVEGVQELAKFTDDITMIVMDDNLVAKPDLLNGLSRYDVKKRFNQQITDFRGEENLSEIEVKDIGTEETYLMKVDGVFEFIGRTPKSDLAKGLGSGINEGREVSVDINQRVCASSGGVLPGVYAAGDLTSEYLKQILSAQSAGLRAADSISKFLMAIEKGTRDT